LFYPPLPGETQAELHKVIRDLDAQRYESALVGSAVRNVFG
jgi:hypothetical protein